MKSIITKPTAKIAVNKNVIKHYRLDTVEMNSAERVFLDGGTEFQIELFNPTKNTLLAKINVNNKSIGSGGLVLYPGQRIFLDRFLDSNNKFKFVTYTVEETEEIVSAIKDNGLVEVEFFIENTNNYLNFYYNIPSKLEWVDTVQCFYNAEIKTPTYAALSPVPTVETGIISKGTKSNQIFTEANIDFQSFATYYTNIIILPSSTKTSTIDDIKHKKYCNNCGSKVKPIDKYCSHCGTKL